MRTFYLATFILLFASVALVTGIADRCQTVLMNRCMKGYREDLNATDSAGGHCFRLQKIVNRVTNEPNCGGELIDKFRYWMLQIAMMDKLLGTCKDIDYTALKGFVQETDVAKTHRYLDDVEFDTFDACAVTVHKKCVRYYVTLLAKDPQMCEDLEKFNKCYDLYSKSISCKAKIIEHYASMVEEVAHRVLQLAQNHMKSLCNRAAEL